MQVVLRPYQEQSVYLLNRALNAPGTNPLCVLPTGSGKSLVLAALLQARDCYALVLSHVAELLEQDALALHRIAPNIEQSFFSAGLGEKKLGTQVIFGSVQSVVRSLSRFRRPRLLLIDEAHLCPRKGDAMYAQVFAHFGMSARAGFTATAQRLDSGSLVEGSDAWFNCIAHEVPVGKLIEDGYLVPLSGVIAEQQADLGDVHSRGGDFIAEEAQAAVIRTLSLPAAVAQACVLAKRRKSWLVFAAGVEHAEKIEHEMRQQGIAAESIFGSTDSDVRKDRIDRFRDGTLRALINVGVLTTGFDAPGIDCIVSMRPTQSPVLWQQMLGRGMRLSQGKVDTLLLDFVGNLDRLGGAGCVTTLTDQRAPAGVIKADMSASKRAKRGAQRNAPSFFDASGRDPMTSGDLFDAAVNRMTYFIVNSRKQPGKRMLVAAYYLEDQFGRAFTARSFVCVEYAGGARYLAVRWFGRRGVTEADVPHDALAALVLAQTRARPHEVQARFDARMRAVVVEHERFD